MSRGVIIRLAVLAALLAAGFFWLHQTPIEPTRVSLYITAIIGAVTTVYALFTYEILLQNQAMARAAVKSTELTERGLRFSYTPNLQYRTLNTKDPLFLSNKDITPVDNEDYRRAIAEQGDKPQQREFVFAVVKNVGHGPATNLKVEAQYKITDSSNVNKESVVTKKASVQVLEADKATALFIFFSRVPTSDDRVILVSATITTSNFYRDALKETPEQIKVDVGNHHVDSEATCLVRLD